MLPGGRGWILAGASCPGDAPGLGQVQLVLSTHVPAPLSSGCPRCHCTDNVTTAPRSSPRHSRDPKGPAARVGRRGLSRSLASSCPRLLRPALPVDSRSP